MKNIALTPPMGWNSWDCYGSAVTEDEVKKNADYMAKHMKAHGWEYVVVDILWFDPMPRILSTPPMATSAWMNTAAASPP